MLKLKPALQQSQGPSKPWSGATLINAFSEMSEGDKYDAFAVMAIPGLDLFSDVSTEAVRGIHRMGNVLYAVIGSTLYSIDSAGVETSLGTVVGSDPVDMDDNGTQLCIVGGVNNDTGYVLSGGTVHTAIPNLPPVSGVTFIDGYMVWTIADSDQFIISGLNDALTYDPLDVATAEGRPDALRGCINDHRELHLPGVDTWEIWYNSGDADFPFARQGNAFIERGTIDRNSVVKIDNSLHFVGDDRVVYRLSGYEPVRISTHAIEFRLEDATSFTAFTYTMRGHKFYVLNTDAGCFAYDMATGAWHERTSFGKSGYRVNCAATAYDQIIMGDAFTGKLYIPNMDSFTEDGDPIPLEIDIPVVEAARALFTVYAFEVYMETGVGNAEETDPQIIMQYSTDNGYTWSNELWRSMGLVGEYKRRAIWRPGIQARTIQFRLKMPTKTRRFVLAYYADYR